VVDAADYSVWRDNFGATIGAGAGSASLATETAPQQQLQESTTISASNLASSIVRQATTRSGSSVLRREIRAAFDGQRARELAVLTVIDSLDLDGGRRRDRSNSWAAIRGQGDESKSQDDCFAAFNVAAIADELCSALDAD
jgi:hypothetical protein